MSLLILLFFLLFFSCYNPPPLADSYSVNLFSFFPPSGIGRHAAQHVVSGAAGPEQDLEAALHQVQIQKSLLGLNQLHILQNYILT